MNGGGKPTSKSKQKKSPTRIQRVFRRVQSKPDSLELLGTSPGSTGSASAGAFFAQQLTKICSGDQLPQPLIDMLVELRNKGHRSFFKKKKKKKLYFEVGNYKRSLEVLGDPWRSLGCFRIALFKLKKLLEILENWQDLFDCL